MSNIGSGLSIGQNGHVRANQIGSYYQEMDNYSRELPYPAPIDNNGDGQDGYYTYTREAVAKERPTKENLTEPTTRWQHCYDDSSQHYYYWHTDTNEVTWEIPEEYQQYLLQYKAYEESLAATDGSQESTSTAKPVESEQSISKAQRRRERRRMKKEMHQNQEQQNEQYVEQQISHQMLDHLTQQAPQQLPEHRPPAPQFTKPSKPKLKSDSEQVQSLAVWPPPGESGGSSDEDEQTDSSFEISRPSKAAGEAKERILGSYTAVFSQPPPPPPPDDSPRPRHLPQKTIIHGPELPLHEHDSEYQAYGPQFPVYEPELPVDESDLPVQGPQLPVHGPQLPVSEPLLPVHGPQLPDSQNGSQRSTPPVSHGLVSYTTDEDDDDDIDSTTEVVEYGPVLDVKSTTEPQADDDPHLDVNSTTEPLEYGPQLPLIGPSIPDSTDNTVVTEGDDSQGTSEGGIINQTSPSAAVQDDEDAAMDSTEVQPPSSTGGDEGRADSVVHVPECTHPLADLPLYSNPNKDDEVNDTEEVDSTNSGLKRSAETDIEEGSTKKKKMDETEMVDVYNTVASKIQVLDQVNKASEMTPLQMLLIQIHTRYTDWVAGVLPKEYFEEKLADACDQVKERETSVAPDGWAFTWDRTYNRYFFQNDSTGESQWERPIDAKMSNEVPEEASQSTPPENKHKPSMSEVTSSSDDPILSIMEEIASTKSPVDLIVSSSETSSKAVGESCDPTEGVDQQAVSSAEDIALPSEGTLDINSTAPPPSDDALKAPPGVVCQPPLPESPPPPPPGEVCVTLPLDSQIEEVDMDIDVDEELDAALGAAPLAPPPLPPHLVPPPMPPPPPPGLLAPSIVPSSSELLPPPPNITSTNAPMNSMYGSWVSSSSSQIYDPTYPTDTAMAGISSSSTALASGYSSSSYSYRPRHSDYSSSAVISKPATSAPKDYDAELAELSAFAQQVSSSAETPVSEESSQAISTQSISAVASTSSEGAVSETKAVVAEPVVTSSGKKEKKKKKDKGLKSTGLAMKKKQLPGMLLKWQNVKQVVEKEIDEEDRMMEERRAELAAIMQKEEPRTYVVPNTVQQKMGWQAMNFQKGSKS